MLWYLTWSWLAFCFLLTHVVHTQAKIVLRPFLRKHIVNLWLACLIILLALFLYMTWQVLLAPAVQLFSLKYSR